MFDPGLIDLVMFLRRSGISDARVLEAFEITPRRYFLESKYHGDAYANRSLPLPCGQTLPPPLTLAMMAHFAGLKSEHKILLVGVGSGYFAAVLSKLVRRVYALERYKTLCETAEARISVLEIENIVIDHQDGLAGWAGQAPYDRIILSGQVDKRPQALAGQLTPLGRLLYVRDGQLRAFEAETEKALIDMDLPPLEVGLSKGL
jgi:protein-L-isoaspartate(D-aspartate) O-methyltransferase